MKGHRRPRSEYDQRPLSLENYVGRPLERLGLDGLPVFAQSYHAPGRAAQDDLNSIDKDHKRRNTYVNTARHHSAQRTIENFGLPAG